MLEAYALNAEQSIMKHHILSFALNVERKSKANVQNEEIYQKLVMKRGGKRMRLIDADAIKYTHYVNGDITVSKKVIDAMPTVEQKHGHWIVIEKDITGYTKYECSNCGKTDDDYSEPIFCKHCGCANGRTSKMDEVTE